MKFPKLFTKVLCVAAALVALSPAADAAIVAHSSATGNQLHSSQTMLTINGVSGKSLNFNMAAAGPVEIALSVECSALLTKNSSGWAGFDILLNGQIVAPTNGPNDDLCDGDIHEVYGMASITVFANAKAGSNAIQVRGTPRSFPGVLEWVSYGDISLVVMK